MTDDTKPRYKDTVTIIADSFVHSDQCLPDIWHKGKKWREIAEEAIRDRDRYKAERDEARRNLCKQTLIARQYAGDTDDTVESIAEEIGWDCFDGEEGGE